MFYVELFYLLIFHLKLDLFIHKHLLNFYSRSGFGLVATDTKITKPQSNIV